MIWNTQLLSIKWQARGHKLQLTQQYSSLNNSFREANQIHHGLTVHLRLDLKEEVEEGAKGTDPLPLKFPILPPAVVGGSEGAELDSSRTKAESASGFTPRSQRAIKRESVWRSRPVPRICDTWYARSRESFALSMERRSKSLSGCWRNQPELESGGSGHWPVDGGRLISFFLCLGPRGDWRGAARSERLKWKQWRIKFLFGLQ